MFGDLVENYRAGTTFLFDNEEYMWVKRTELKTQNGTELVLAVKTTDTAPFVLYLVPFDGKESK